MKSGKKLAKWKLVVLIFFLNGIIQSSEVGVIKNPLPNMVETDYIPLKRVKTVGVDLGSDEFLFKPFSMTVDPKGNLYVYDILQAKILKFDENLRFIASFGRRGQGPGEFSGTGKLSPVFIKMGRDGKLYANDLRARKITVFNVDGKYIGEWRYKKAGIRSPVVDFKSNIYFFSIKGNQIRVNNQSNYPLLKLTAENKNFYYLFSGPGLFYRNMAYKHPLNDIYVDLSLSATLLVYFQSSSTIILLKDNEVRQTINIWPAEALKIYRTELFDILKRKPNRYRSLFIRLLVDEGNPDLFYLQFGENKERNMNTIYQFSLNGELRGVFFVNLEGVSAFTRFEAVKSGRFYAIEGEQISIYKENKR